MAHPVCTIRMAAVCLMLALIAGNPAFAQQQDAIPEAPAFTFLDVAPAEISRPITPRALSTSLLNAISADGRVQQGFALDAAPWLWIPGMSINLPAYQSERSKYALANTQLSLATVRASGDSASTDLSLGARVTLIDYSDPMRDPAFTDALRQTINSECPLPDQPGAVDRPLECVREVNRRMREAFAEENWNGYSLAVAAATGWRLTSSFVDNASPLGWSVWSTASAPLDKWGQVIGQVRYARREGLDLLGDSERLTYGVRVLVGSHDVNGFLEITGASALGTSDEDLGSQWASGIEFRVGEGMWLATGFGNGENVPDIESPLVVIANLRWELRDKASLQP